MVEEDEYRSTYRALSRQRCVFEKAVLTRRCNCRQSNRFYLADREGVSCRSTEASQNCRELLELMRENARFALKIRSPVEKLPHAQEIKVQSGGLLGLQHLLRPDLSATTIVDVNSLTVLAQHTYGSLRDIPYHQLIKSIVSFEGRPRSRPRR